MLGSKDFSNNLLDTYIRDCIYNADSQTSALAGNSRRTFFLRVNISRFSPHAQKRDGRSVLASAAPVDGTQYGAGSP
jgi:hypothetical protein